MVCLNFAHINFCSSESNNEQKTLAEYDVKYLEAGPKAEEKSKDLKVTLAKVKDNHLSLWVLDVVKPEDDGPYWCDVTVVEETKTSSKTKLTITRKCYLLGVCFIHLISKCEPLIGTNLTKLAQRVYNTFE